MNFKSDPSYPAYPIFSFLGFVLVLVPLPWHLQAWNAGTCLYMIWTSIACLNMFINSVVWHGSALNKAPVWCDISVHLIIAVAVAIPAASLCINRRLYKIANGSMVSVSRQERRNAVIIDLCIGLGIPIIQVPLQYIVQGHRFDILEDIGCQPSQVNTPPAYPLVILWPLMISLVSACYCALTLRAFMKRRTQFSEFLNAANSSLTLNRYFRLMALATMEYLFTIPISIYGLTLWLNHPGAMAPFNWAAIHFDFSRVGIYPAVLWRYNRDNETSVELTRWSVPFCAFVFFAFFGFADEARRHYKMAFWAIARRLGFQPPQKKQASPFVRMPGSKARPQPNSSTSESLPVYAPRTTYNPQRNSFSSEKHVPSVYSSAYHDLESGIDFKTPGSASTFSPSSADIPSSLHHDNLIDPPGIPRAL
ncbi:STE3-domain-containing protein [Neolentinus lepideus HHB14362 ss-1]|uniref:STE3-domain-containing protein n=1 Tax=Neolentinus lepideus HHB14362 ss-1 TaxID=1314782 RepID=A0A165NFS5_9AGAM|nr:STE3-domain-containing protein [Neolentinus lepideus HHB14362 ss-1]